MSMPEVFVVELNDNKEYQRLLAGEPQTFGMKSGRVYLSPGQDCGQHSTEHREELLVFLSGEGLLLIEDGQSYEVGRGKISYIPPNTVHNVKNSGLVPLIYIYCVSPANGQMSEE